MKQTVLVALCLVLAPVALACSLDSGRSDSSCTVAVCGGVAHPGTTTTTERVDSNFDISWSAPSSGDLPVNFTGTVEYRWELHENDGPADINFPPATPLDSGTLTALTDNVVLDIDLSLDKIHTVVWVAREQGNITNVFAVDCLDFKTLPPIQGTPADPTDCNSLDQCNDNGDCVYSGGLSPLFECDCDEGGYEDPTCIPLCDSCPNANFGCSTPNSCDFCLGGWTGDNCNEEGCTDSPDSCIHGGTCTGLPENKCVGCEEGVWGGDYCTEPLCTAQSFCNNSTGNGECSCPPVGCTVESAADPVCQCFAPYTGLSCELGPTEYAGSAIQFDLAPGELLYVSFPVESRSTLSLKATPDSGDVDIYWKGTAEWPTSSDAEAQSALTGTVAESITVEKFDGEGKLLLVGASDVESTSGQLVVTVEETGLSPLVVIGGALGAAAIVGIGTIAFVRRGKANGAAGGSGTKASSGSSGNILDKYKSDSTNKGNQSGSAAGAVPPSQEGSAHTAAGAVNRRAANKKPGVKFGANSTQEAPKRPKAKSVSKGKGGKGGKPGGLVPKEGGKGPGHKRTGSAGGRKPSADGRGSRGGRSKSPNKGKRLSTGNQNKPMGGGGSKNKGAGAKRV